MAAHLQSRWCPCNGSTAIGADANLVVLDIRSAIDGSKPETFAQGHIPGAVHSDYDKAGWRVTRNNVPFMVPTTPELEKLIGDLGIDENSHVVVVPAGVNVLDFGSAARTYWTLKYAGVANVSILDGGLAAWKAAGYAARQRRACAVAGDLHRHARQEFCARRPRSRKSSTTAAPRWSTPARLRSSSARRRRRPRRPMATFPARSISTAREFYDPATNRLKPKAELATIAGELPAGATVTYCNTGHWAATDWFVLHELLGHKQARLYAGSMVEWTSNASRPIESARTKWDDLKKKLGMGT